MDCAYASRCFPHARAVRERRLRLQAVPAAARCPLLRAHVRAQVLDGEVDERLRVKGRRGPGPTGFRSTRVGSEATRPGVARGKGARRSRWSLRATAAVGLNRDKADGRAGQAASCQVGNRTGPRLRFRVIPQGMPRGGGGGGSRLRPACSTVTEWLSQAAGMALRAWPASRAPTLPTHKC